VKNKKQIKKDYKKEEMRHDIAYEKENKLHENKHNKEIEDAFRTAGNCKNNNRDKNTSVKNTSVKKGK
jgi:hypothetical protein